MASRAGKTEGSLATRTTRLNEHVSLTRPLENAHDKSSPSLVIIFGWFEAKFSHIAKYVDDYQRLYPAATVVVVESHFDWMYSTQRTRESCLEPVADILDELIESAGVAGFRGVILHVMSNGGAAQAMILSKVLAKRTRHTNARYPAAVVLDSTPDSHTLRCFLAGISASFSHPLAHLMAPPLVFLLYAVFRFSYGVTTPLLPEVRQRLNSPTFIPFYRNPARHKDGSLIDYPKIPASADISKEIQLIPRLYVCSKTDEITNFESVRNHIEEAKRSGLDVRAEIYDKSPHVSHARVDPERYWGAVQQLWKDARSRTVPARL